jgi:hypothetical protein
MEGKASTMTFGTAGGGFGYREVRSFHAGRCTAAFGSALWHTRFILTFGLISKKRQLLGSPLANADATFLF